MRPQGYHRGRRAGLAERRPRGRFAFATSSGNDRYWRIAGAHGVVFARLKSTVPDIRDQCSGQVVSRGPSSVLDAVGATMDVGSWLRSLGLGQYEVAFRENEIDGEVLPELTDHHLKDLGVSLGHRQHPKYHLRPRVRGIAHQKYDPRPKPAPL